MRRLANRVACGMLGLHALFIGWIGFVSSPNLNELPHLASGISHWRFGNFELYRVNPPLVRCVAAIPPLLAGARMEWSGISGGQLYGRAEFVAARAFVDANGESTFWYLTIARWACLPLSLLGGWACYCWARDLYGYRAAMLACALYCFCPNLLAWGASITPDAGAAALGVLSGYAFWRWLREPGWFRAGVAWVTLALAVLSKSTWLVLLLLWPTVWGIWRFAGNTSSAERGIDPPLRQLISILVCGVFWINFTYGFEGSFKHLDQYRFVSRMLSGHDTPEAGGNRFLGRTVGALPVPLPENFVRGLDIQQREFEQKKWSYLHGEQKKGGWWWYYLYALGIKTPVGTLALVGLASLCVFFRAGHPFRSRDCFVVLLPAFAVLALVSSQTGFNRYMRYILPAIPFLFVWISQVAERTTSRLSTAFVIAAVTFSAVESLWTIPHSLSFFNAIVGGPACGPSHLLDANVDWGQDLIFLKRWYDTNGEGKPLHLAYFGPPELEPGVVGIEWLPIATKDQSRSSGVQRTPGWYAISVNLLAGYHHWGVDDPAYQDFASLSPVARAGYSIVIYELPPDLSK